MYLPDEIKVIVDQELKVLRSAYRYLVNSISVASILPEVRSTELITVCDYEDCIAEGTVCKQAEKLMQCVERAVIADPGNFNLFLSILDRCEQKSIAEYLRLLNRSMMLAKIQLPGETIVISRNIKMCNGEIAALSMIFSMYRCTSVST